jgi:hypothetical protein
MLRITKSAFPGLRLKTSVKSVGVGKGTVIVVSKVVVGPALASEGAVVMVGLVVESALVLPVLVCSGPVVAVVVKSVPPLLVVPSSGPALVVIEAGSVVAVSSGPIGIEVMVSVPGLSVLVPSELTDDVSVGLGPGAPVSCVPVVADSEETSSDTELVSPGGRSVAVLVAWLITLLSCSFELVKMSCVEVGGEGMVPLDTVAMLGFDVLNDRSDCVEVSTLVCSVEDISIAIDETETLESVTASDIVEISVVADINEVGDEDISVVEISVVIESIDEVSVGGVPVSVDGSVVLASIVEEISEVVIAMDSFRVVESTPCDPSVVKSTVVDSTTAESVVRADSSVALEIGETSSVTVDELIPFDIVSTMVVELGLGGIVGVNPDVVGSDIVKSDVMEDSAAVLAISVGSSIEDGKLDPLNVVSTTVIESEFDTPVVVNPDDVESDIVESFVTGGSSAVVPAVATSSVVEYELTSTGDGCAIVVESTIEDSTVVNPDAVDSIPIETDVVDGALMVLPVAVISIVEAGELISVEDISVAISSAVELFSIPEDVMSVSVTRADSVGDGISADGVKRDDRDGLFSVTVTAIVGNDEAPLSVVERDEPEKGKEANESEKDVWLLELTLSTKLFEGSSVTELTSVDGSTVELVCSISVWSEDRLDPETETIPDVTELSSDVNVFGLKVVICKLEIDGSCPGKVA